MVNRPENAVAENQVEDDETDGEEEVKPIHRNRGRVDAFADAFEAAEKELSGEDKAAKAKPKSKAPPADKIKDEKAAEKTDKKNEKPKPELKRKPDEVADDDNEDGDGDDADAVAERKAEQKKAKGPLEPKKYWPKERREAFAYQPRHVQEIWLEEAPAPNGHWSEERKAIFVKQPREVQEEWLVHSQDLERGFSEKFHALANERKLADGVRNAVTPAQREAMRARGIDEVGAFTALMRVQEASTRDPEGYVRDFIMRNKLDPRRVLGVEGDVGGNGSNGVSQQADITSHPAYRTLKAEVDAMKASQMEEARRRNEETDRKISSDMSAVLAEKDDEGNSAYPYVRLLASPMAAILSADPERFDPMGTRERFVTAYKLALKEFPELEAISRTAKPATVDEPDDEDADAEEEQEEEKLRRARTKKSQRPAAAPRDRGDPFDRALLKAEKQLRQR